MPKTLEEMIKEIYETEHVANDWELMFKVLRRFQNQFCVTVEFDGFTWILKIPISSLKIMPAFESITRAKRKLKEDLRKKAIAELKTSLL